MKKILWACTAFTFMATGAWASNKGHQAEQGVAPEQALTFLKNGNKRFLSGKWRKDGASKKDITRLSTGQKPHAIVLSCSDSRVPPELVFDQKLGEIFVVRTAGETLDPTSIASIEYAVDHLGSKLILVMGHTACGAVKAALGTMNGEDAGTPNLNKLVADIHPRIQEFKTRAPASDVNDASWSNARGVTKDLVARSPFLAEKLKGGNIRVIPALYYLNDGHVDFDETSNPLN